MVDVKILKSILTYKKNLLIIRARSNFKITFKKIKKNRKEFIFLEKPRTSQMFAVLIWRLLGKKFLWIQNFENPPIPDFFTRILLNQSDEIMVSSRKEASRLKSMGIDKPRKRIRK